MILFVIIFQLLFFNFYKFLISYYSLFISIMYVIYTYLDYIFAYTNYQQSIRNSIRNHTSRLACPSDHDCVYTLQVSITITCTRRCWPGT